MAISFKSFVVLIVLAAIISQEVDARRTILKGRKALTRTYYRDAAVPAWAVVILVALGEIIFGGILFVILKKKIIDPPITGSYTPANIEDP